MGHIFKINPNMGQTTATVVDWSKTNTTPYTHGIVDAISATTNSQKEITSIPSPFARIELVKEAFGKIVPDSINSLLPDQVLELLHGNTIYHKMVSDSLDVGQIFFSYPSMKDKVEIVVWDKNVQINQLLNSPNKSHKIVGKTLDMFFQQDSLGQDSYNFGKMQNIYILKYKGPGQKQMHIIGATSPATLFFSTANDESNLSQHLVFGTDKAFDSEYASLDQRDSEYIKYLFTFRFSDQQFDVNYPEVAKYLDAVYCVLDNELKNAINNIQDSIQNQTTNISNFINANYNVITFDASPNVQYQVEINGLPLHTKNVKISGNSDFEIKASKQINGSAPLVLPNKNSNAYAKLQYYGTLFGSSFTIPAFDSNPLAARSLPGIGHQYPYLTISDFLDDKILKLPTEINKDFFDGNYSSSTGRKEGYLLPIKQEYFDYFTVEDLMGNSPSGKKTIEIQSRASGVEVILRIPIQNGNEIEYKRIYTQDVKADQVNNKGAMIIAPWHLGIGIFPPVQFANEIDAHYRIAIISTFNLNKEYSCQCHSETHGLFIPNYVVRNVDIEDDLRSKIYLLDGKSFDCAFISAFTDQPGQEKKVTGLMVPKFRKRTGNAAFSFAIDLGTSNTHIEYTTAADSMPKPFEFTSEQPQMSLVCNPSDAVLDHVRAEFIPEAIGSDANCHFPMRTVLCADKINAGIDEKGSGSYVAFGNASPAFMYNKSEIGTKYSDFIPNLKWSQMNPLNEERIRCYIESLFMIIRNKVISEGGSLSQTEIRWFYPISMSNNKKGLFERVWTSAYKKYFNPSGTPISITESVAPYSFFQRTMPGVSNVVTIDIGGETTDIVVANTRGVDCVSSMRFAADAIFGSSLVDVSDGCLNGIIRKYKDYFIDKLSHSDELGILRKMLEEKTKNNFGNSSEVASFLFSLSENDLVISNNLREQVDFNEVLMRDDTIKVVFYIFFSAIMYHLANLMKAKSLEVPTNIAFSGNGSKVISVLSPNKASLEKLTNKIFGLIYAEPVTNIKLIINSENPKEATCKGGLFLNHEPNISDAKSILLGTNKTQLRTDETYDDASSIYEKVCEEVMNFLDFIIFEIPEAKVSLSNEFGIEKRYLELAQECFNVNLKTYVEKGVDLKVKSGDVNHTDVIEETLFFYPIIGVLNDLSDKICDNF